MISESLNICSLCIKRNFTEILRHIREIHRKIREDFNLPTSHNKEDGIKCNLCLKECKIPDKERGHYALRQNIGGKFIGPDYNNAYLTYYHDALPTNCVAYWVCSGCAGRGYQEFAYRNGPEIGYKNLAVFYLGCSFFLIASTLLVPGYIYRTEVFNIAKFIAQLDNSISYSLLGFAPNFYISVLPFTYKRHASECLEVAKEAGLVNVHIGNYHLLGDAY